MSDILLSVGMQKGHVGTSQLETDIKDVVARINQNPPTIKVGLAVSQSAINHFKSQLTKVVNSVSLSNGSPITINISGLGEITSQANAAAEAIKNVSKAASGTTGSTSGMGDKQLTALIRINSELKSMQVNYTKWASTPIDGLSQHRDEYFAQIQLLQTLKQSVIDNTISNEQFSKTFASIRIAAGEAAGVISRTIKADNAKKKAVADCTKEIELLKQQQEKWTDAKSGVTADDYKSLAEYQRQLENLLAQFEAGSIDIDEFTSKTAALTAEANKARGRIQGFGKDTKSLGDRLKGLAEKFGAWLTVSQAIMMAVRAIKKMVSAVIEVDRAMTELKKVTNETSEVYDRFLTNASRRAKQLGASVSDVVNATADFARLGYNIEDASSLADAALIYKNIGDGIEDITEASESLISTMQAFGIEASNALSIIDKFNEVGNNFAISSAGIGEALQRSAASMAAANNTLEETIALATAANTIVQNPETVGTTLKTISMYLRAARTEAEETGETTEGMAGSLSELRSEILSLTGQKVDIQIDANTFKSTYQILKELSLVWDELSDVSQANILELVGGKRNANVVAALLDNFSVAENALATANEASGSAMKENEKHLDSIQGKLDQFKSAFEAFSNSFIESDVVKFFVDAGTTILKILNSISSQCGITEIAITGLFMALARSNRIGNMFIEKTYSATSGEKGIFEAFAMNNKMGIKQSAGEILQLAENTGVATENVKAFLLAEKTGPKTLANFEKWMSTQNGQTIKLSKSFKNLWISAKKTFESMSAYIVMLNAVRAVSDIFDLIKSMNEPAKSIQEQFDELSSELSSVNSELSSLESELQSVESQIESLLKQGELSFTDSEELARLQSVSRELENQIELTKTLQENLEKNFSEVALSAYADYSKNTSFYSEQSKEERKEEAKSIGSTIGNVAGMIIGVAVAKNPMVGAAIGSSLGSILGNFSFGAISDISYKSEFTVEEALDNMVAERARFELLQDNAYALYKDSPTDSNKEKWQESSQALSEYNAALSTHIQQLVEYYNSVEYSSLSTEQQREQFRAIGDDIDRYNIMMGAQGSINAALDRMFGEEQITDDMAKLRDVVKTALSIADGERVFSYDLELSGCEEAVSRLMSVGATVTHVIQYFDDMKEAEDAAFDYSTYEMIENIASLEDGMNTLIDAFQEFNEEGLLTAETIIKLNSLFGTLGDKWKNYVDVMTSGSSTTQQAIDATNELAEAKIKELKIAGGIRLNKKVINADGTTSWIVDSEKYQTYLTAIAQLEALNVTNAKELVDALQQQAMIQAIIAEQKADAAELETLRAKESLTEAEKARKTELENRNDQYYVSHAENQYGTPLVDTELLKIQRELDDAQEKAKSTSTALSHITNGSLDFLTQANANEDAYRNIYPEVQKAYDEWKSYQASFESEDGIRTIAASILSAPAEAFDFLASKISGQDVNLNQTVYDYDKEATEKLDKYKAQIDTYKSANQALFDEMINIANEHAIDLSDIQTSEFNPLLTGENSIFYQVYSRLVDELGSDEYDLLVSELSGIVEDGFNSIGMSPNIDLNLDNIIIDGLESGYSLFEAITEEIKNNGEISIDTLKALAAAEKDYLDYLYVENGQLRVNTELWNERYITQAKDSLQGYQNNIDRLEQENIVLGRQLDKAKSYFSDDNPDNDYSAHQLIETLSNAISRNTDEILKNESAISILSNVIDSYMQKIDEATQSKIDPVSVGQGLYSLKSGFEMLQKIYEDMDNEGNFDYGAILNSQEFIDTFSNLGDVYDDFISGILGSTESIYLYTRGVGLLAEAYIEQSGILDMLTDDTRELSVALLESMGVVNAAAIVDGRLAEAKDYAAYSSENFENMTYAEVAALAAEAEAGSFAEQMLLRVAAAKLYAWQSGSDAASSKDIKHFMELAMAAGLTTDAYETLSRVLEYTLQYEDALQRASISTDESIAESARNEAAELRRRIDDNLEHLSLDFEMIFDFSNKSSEKEETWFEKQYKEHQHLVAMGQETDAEYLEWLNAAYQKAYANNIITLDDCYKYQEEVYNGLQDLFKDHISDIDYEISMFGDVEGSSDEIIVLYQKAMNDIERELAKARASGLDENGDYIQYLKKQWKDYSDSVIDLREQAETEIKDSIDQLVEYRVDMLKQEINDEKDALNEKLDALKEFYDKQREMLQDQHDEEKYLEEQAEKRKTVTELKEELDWLTLNDSAWAQRRKHELQEQLAEAEKELADFEKDHALDITLDMLDEQQSQQEEQIQAEIDALDELLNDPHSLFNQALADIKGNTAALYNGFIEYNRKHGSGNDQDIIDMWEGAYKADQEYQDTHNGQHKDDIVIGNYTGYAPDVRPTSPNSTTSNSTGSAGNPGSVSNLSQTLTYGSKGEGVKALQRALNALGFGNAGTASVDGSFGKQTAAAVRAYQTARGVTPTGNVGPETKLALSKDGYASGTMNATPGAHEVDELGPEYLFISPSDGSRYRIFTGGEKVLNAEATNFLYDFATSGGGIITKMLSDLFGLNNFSGITRPLQAIELHAGDIIVQGNATERTVSEIRRAQRENLDFVIREFNKLNK